MLRGDECTYAAARRVLGRKERGVSERPRSERLSPEKQLASFIRNYISTRNTKHF